MQSRQRLLHRLLLLLPVLAGLLLRLLLPSGSERLFELLSKDGTIAHTAAVFYSQADEALPVCFETSG